MSNAGGGNVTTHATNITNGDSNTNQQSTDISKSSHDGAIDDNRVTSEADNHAVDNTNNTDNTNNSQQNQTATPTVVNPLVVPPSYPPTPTVSP